ncbi:hypothetical protein D1646_12960 [Pseudoflavonifractor sp. 60]|uniref:stage III sporulation protein AB n=1 Tax=Pseudoflavonifractor sp. 60 TaxID=2304576 RepID=UPI0013714C79|nr:stage III sporulation protein AB [Pseudoflavonifractor sp. 60]NBI67693.1 hypothetical protein [Pseudoflavonifractor sp. 60]
MLRLMGAVLVALGGTWLGFRAADGLRRQVRELRRMAAGLAVLEGELELNAPPLAQLLGRGARYSEGGARELFQACAQGLDRLDREDFPSLWRRQTGRKNELGPEGQAVLASLADILGRCELQRQQQALAAARRRLEELAGQREQDCRSRGRVYQALGVSGGAFLIILLL